MREILFPNLLNLARAASRAAWARLRGYELLVTPGEREARLDRCDWCEHLTQCSQCRLCTCLVAGKTWLAMEKCPAGRWKAVWRKKNRA
jgi:hypothetical protein